VWGVGGGGLLQAGFKRDQNPDTLDRICGEVSMAGRVSSLLLGSQVVPQEEQLHYSVRLLQTPSNFPNADPDNVVWLDLEVPSPPLLLNSQQRWPKGATHAYHRHSAVLSFVVFLLGGSLPIPLPHTE